MPEAPGDDWRDVVLCFDGEIRFFKAANEKLQLQLSGHNIRVHLFKFAAACSKTQQPQDVGTQFMTFRLLCSLLFARDALNEAGYRYCTAVPAYLVQVELALRAFETPSQRVFRPVLEQLPFLLNKSFSQDAILKSWQVSGVHPLNVQRILERSASWESFSEEQRSAITASIPALTAIVAQRGQVTDPEIQHAVGPSIDFLQWMTVHTGAAPKKGKALAKKVQHYRRALIPSHPEMVAERAQLASQAAVKKAKKTKQAQKNAAQEASSENLAGAAAVDMPAAAVAPAAAAKRKRAVTVVATPAAAPPSNTVASAPAATPVVAPTLLPLPKPKASSKKARLSPPTTPAAPAAAAPAPAAPAPAASHTSTRGRVCVRKFRSDV